MNKLSLRVGIGVLASPLEVGAERAPVILAMLADRLQEKGVDVISSPVPLDNADAATLAGRFFVEQHIDALCLAVASWFEDYLKNLLYYSDNSGNRPECFRKA